MRHFDTHAHVNLAPLVANAASILREAASLGIMVNVVGVDGPSSQKACELARDHANAFCSVGVHPNEVGTLGGALEAHMVAIERLLVEDGGRIVCVGETGLDASRGGDLDLQTACLRRHIALAERFDKPLNLHCRDAHPAMIALLQQVTVPRIIHCFTAGPDEAAAYIRMGCFLSIPGVVTFKGAAALHEAVRQTPWEYLLVETDAPYLAPVPLRGKVNTPLNVVHTVARVALLKGTILEEAAAILFANALRAFRLSQPE